MEILKHIFIMFPKCGPINSPRDNPSTEFITATPTSALQGLISFFVCILGEVWEKQGLGTEG